MRLGVILELKRVCLKRVSKRYLFFILISLFYKYIEAISRRFSIQKYFTDLYSIFMSLKQSNSFTQLFKSFQEKRITLRISYGSIEKL